MHNKVLLTCGFEDEFQPNRLARFKTLDHKTGAELAEGSAATACSTTCITLWIKERKAATKNDI